MMSLSDMGVYHGTFGGAAGKPAAMGDVMAWGAIGLDVSLAFD